MDGMIPPAAAALALAVAAGAAPGGERVVEEVVAIVRNPPGAPPRVITWTKLVEEARIALVSRGATEAASRPLDPEALRAALEWLVDQVLVSDEAGRLRLGEIDRAEVLAELRAFRGRFARPAGYEEFLRRAELSEDELAATLARTLRVQRYVESRVGREARVGEEEVDRWLRERGTPEAAGPAREAVRARLAEEKAAAQVKELLRELRARADVRILGGLRGTEAS